MDLDARLAEVEARHERVQAEMAEPNVASDPDRLRRLGKEFAELQEIVVPYRELKDARQQAEEARALAKGERDPEMAAFLREESDAADARAVGLRAALEELLVTKDPNDDKDVVVEVRAGAGGEEAALWAGELLELYRHYAERHGWKTDVLSASPSDLGGFKEVVLEVRGAGTSRACTGSSACRSPSPRAGSTRRRRPWPCSRRPRTSTSRSARRT
jgi:peptide chain release factor 1